MSCLRWIVSSLPCAAMQMYQSSGRPFEQRSPPHGSTSNLFTNHKAPSQHQSEQLEKTF